jgi:hypothetical protein
VNSIAIKFNVTHQRYLNQLLMKKIILYCIAKVKMSLGLCILRAELMLEINRKQFGDVRTKERKKEKKYCLLHSQNFYTDVGVFTRMFFKLLA